MKIYIIILIVTINFNLLSFNYQDVDNYSIKIKKSNLIDFNIHLNPGLNIKWNTGKNLIIKDSNFIKLKNNFNKYKFEIFNILYDTTKINLYICDSLKLKKCDIALILLDNILQIPYFEVFNIQFDCIEYNCFYSMDFYYYFHNNRDEAIRKLKKYYKIGNAHK